MNCLICHTTLPKGRSKYCSNECGNYSKTNEYQSYVENNTKWIGEHRYVYITSDKGDITL